MNQLKTPTESLAGHNFTLVAIGLFAFLLLAGILGIAFYNSPEASESSEPYLADGGLICKLGVQGSDSNVPLYNEISPTTPDRSADGTLLSSTLVIDIGEREIVKSESNPNGESFAKIRLSDQTYWVSASAISCE